MTKHPLYDIGHGPRAFATSLEIRQTILEHLQAIIADYGHILRSRTFQATLTEFTSAETVVATAYKKGVVIPRTMKAVTWKYFDPETMVMANTLIRVHRTMDWISINYTNPEGVPCCLTLALREGK